MLRIRMLRAAVAACLLTLILCAPAFAQDPPTDDGRRGHGGHGGRGPFPGGPGFGFIESEMRFGGKTVKGAPYSAKAVTEFVQTLSDGTKITRRNEATIYRDSEGRTRREQKLNAVGPFATQGDAPQLVFITDPVAGVAYSLNARDKTARKMTLHTGPPSDAPRPRQSSQAKTESLGRQIIEGVACDGTRSTITIPAGQIGNDRPIEIVSERWYSPELQVVVLSKHSDPRLGEHTYRLTNINRSEPAVTLFQVPTDYTIKERGNRPGGFGSKMGRPGKSGNNGSNN